METIIMVTQQDVSNADYHYRDLNKQWVIAKQKLNFLIRDLHAYRDVLLIKDYNTVKRLTKLARVQAQNNVLDLFNEKHKAHQRKEEVLKAYHSNTNIVKQDKLKEITQIIAESLTLEQLELLQDNKTAILNFQHNKQI